MKIVLVQSAPYLPSLGGANKGNRLLLEKLASRGHSCRAIGTAGEGAPGDTAFRHAGVEVEVVGDSSRLRGHVARRLRELDADRILVSSEDPAQMLLQAALEARPGRVIYLAHTTLQLPFGPEGFLDSPERTGLLRQAAGIITLSGYMRDYFRRWAGLEAAVLRFPVYGDGPFPELADFDHGAVTLINPCAVKGIAIFLELARRCPDLPFLAVPTWGTTEEDLAALAALPNIRVRPPSPDIDEILRETRVLLVPSLWGEAFGHVTVEAMLRGIPVLASDVGGLPEAKLGVDYVLPVHSIERYEERFDGRRIPVAAVSAQDAGPWERALCELLADRGRYERLAAESRRAASTFVAGFELESFERFFASLSPEIPALEAPQTAGAQAGRREKLDRLSPERLELLKRKLRKGEEAPAPAGIPRLPRSVAVESAFPVSFAQQRIWLLHRLDPERTDYNESLALRITGRLHPAVLAAGLSEIVRRHEVLRTRYTDNPEGPVQVIAAPSPFLLPEVDLCALPPELREAAAIRLAREEGGRPFALAHGPVLRAALLRLDEADEHLLLFTVHHIAADSWSITVALRELAQLYRALAAGEPPTLPELPIQYADFSVWQRQWLSGEVLATQLAAWRSQLAGAPPLLELPTDRPRPAVQGHSGATVSRSLPQPLAAALKSLARNEDITLYMLLLAAFAILFHRYSGAADLVVGTPIVGRGRKETEGLIGFFLNSLPMRVRPAAGLTVRGLLKQVRSTAVEAFAHQDLPFERLVEELAPQRDLSTTPIFQVFLNVQSTPPQGLELEGLRSVTVPVERGVTKLDLDLYIEESEPGLGQQMTYSTDLFDAATVVRLLGHFRTLLEELEEGIERPVSELPLLTAAEAHQLATEWNDTGRPAGGRAVHQLVAAQAARTPGATAVVFGEESLTYAELRAHALGLARRLRQMGIGPESRVGVAMERSLDLLPALLGVLEAGAAYVPLDPEHPRERLAGMLADSRPAALLTQSWRLSSLPEWDGPRLCLDRDEGWWAGGEGIPDGFLDESQLAYVIYTSGSTGRPKGVQISHGALANFLSSMAERPGLKAGDVLLAVTTLSFDIAALELFLPLTLGARVAVASRETAADGARLAGEIERTGATVLQATPATWRMLLGAGWAGSPSLTAFCGGEALPRDLARELLAHTAALWNLYGPTETTVWSAAHPVRDAERTIAVGRPIADTSIHLVDPDLWPVPIGVPGEMLIGGAGVARGYVGRSDLTAERFVPDPFGPPGARLYRTGDLARALPGGESELLCRIDHQVKIRGFRIEPGEIETILGEHPGVRQAVVLARAVDGDTRLVAYIVPAGEAPTATALRDFLAARLPAYMVPSVFTVLDALPLSPSGKVDRRALPEPEASRLASGTPFVSPGTPVERELARLWSEALGCPEVSRHDSFFLLGGHSLLATRLIPRYREAFGVELELLQLFEAPTLEQLGRLIESLQESRAVAPAPAAGIPRVSRAGFRIGASAQEAGSDG
ncbi:MAG TPA: amino acid adenylation domain-containing protein [Thermoanaerobaculia bacterium]|nr:amino acid adenylation domain-containing protein [Thermoanaerobaculia bacterium]